MDKSGHTLRLHPDKLLHIWERRILTSPSLRHCV
jgi:hypothetical protein